jgi:hypothetical protein
MSVQLYKKCSFEQKKLKLFHTNVLSANIRCTSGIS